MVVRVLPTRVLTFQGTTLRIAMQCAMSGLSVALGRQEKRRETVPGMAHCSLGVMTTTRQARKKPRTDRGYGWPIISRIVPTGVGVKCRSRSTANPSGPRAASSSESAK